MDNKCCAPDNCPAHEMVMEKLRVGEKKDDKFERYFITLFEKMNTIDKKVTVGGALFVCGWAVIRFVVPLIVKAAG